MLEIILTIVGLILFETISSIDNAVINAKVLGTVSDRAKRWFLTWGLLISVFAVRGLLPLLIVWIANPGLGPFGAATAAFSSDPAVGAAIETTKPILLAGGGLYLVLLFLHWLLMEEKHFAFRFERTLNQKYAVWFYALASLTLVTVTWLTISRDPLIALGAVIGSSAFFITSGFKANAEAAEKAMLDGHSGKSDLSKLLYLELIDATFSIDGVLGAFAFTTAVPLILLGNGIGAIVVRQITIHGIETVKRLPYLSNGAMYSVSVLGIIMLLESLHIEVPFWITPASTITIVGYFAWRSFREAGPQRTAKA